MIWTAPDLKLIRVTPKVVAAEAIVAGTNFTADGEGFDDGAHIVFVKHAILITLAALTPALEGQNEVVESDVLLKFRLKEKSPPKRGVYDAVIVQPRKKKLVYAIRKKALRIT